MDVHELKVRSALVVDPIRHYFGVEVLTGRLAADHQHQA